MLVTLKLATGWPSGVMMSDRVMHIVFFVVCSVAQTFDQAGAPLSSVEEASAAAAGASFAAAALVAASLSLAASLAASFAVSLAAGLAAGFASGLAAGLVSVLAAGAVP